MGWEDPLEEEMATHSSILAWRIPWTEEPGGLQSMGLQRVGYDWNYLAFMHTVYHSWLKNIRNIPLSKLNLLILLLIHTNVAVECFARDGVREMYLRARVDHMGQASKELVRICKLGSFPIRDFMNLGKVKSVCSWSWNIWVWMKWEIWA